MSRICKTATKKKTKLKDQDHEFVHNDSFSHYCHDCGETLHSNQRLTHYTSGKCKG